MLGANGAVDPAGSGPGGGFERDHRQRLEAADHVPGQPHRLTDLEPAQGELLGEILAGPVITEAELVAAGVLPVAAAARKARHRAADVLFEEQEAR